VFFLAALHCINDQNLTATTCATLKDSSSGVYLHVFFFVFFFLYNLGYIVIINIQVFAAVLFRLKLPSTKITACICLKKNGLG